MTSTKGALRETGCAQVADDRSVLLGLVGLFILRYITFVSSFR